MSFRFTAVGALAASAVLLGFAAPAQSASVVGATKVRVSSAVPTWIQVSELQAFELGTGINVAAAANGGVASATSVYSVSYGPGWANDGVVGPQFYHSAGNDDDYLEILFAGARSLKSLTIYGRADCCWSRDIYKVEIFGSGGGSLYSGVMNASNGDLVSVTFDDPRSPGGVPEPSAWALMILGFGAAGMAIRRRQPVTA